MFDPALLKALLFPYTGTLESPKMCYPCACVHVVVASVSRIIPLLPLAYATLNRVASVFEVHWLQPSSRDLRSLLDKYRLHL